jgi:hypothetical protein
VYWYAQHSTYGGQSSNQTEIVPYAQTTGKIGNGVGYGNHKQTFPMSKEKGYWA